MSTGSDPDGDPGGRGGAAAGDPRQNVAAQGTIVAGMTLVSRLSGFARDMVLSYFFGAGAIADAFFVAFRIPNFFRRLFAEGAFSQAFVPVLSRYRNEPRAAYLAFISAIAGNLSLALLAIVGVGVTFAPALIYVFAPGFHGSPVQFELATAMTRITFPYLAFISLTAFAAAVLNSHQRYAVPAFTPVLLNLSLIAAMLIGVRWFEQPVFALAWGVFVAGAVQLLFQLPFLARLGLVVMPRPSLAHPGVRQVGRLLVPAVFAASVSQINALVDTILASTLMTGSISWLYYADRLLELPVGLVAVALGTVLLPNLSRLSAAGNSEGFAATLDWGLRMGILLGLPAAVALYLLALPLVATIFQHGAMTTIDARMAALALQAFALGLLPLVLVKVLAPAYFAREDTATPFRFACVAVATNIVLNLATFRWFGHVGLAFATTASAWMNAGLLLRGVLRAGVYRPGRALTATVLRVVLGCLVMAAVIWLLLPAAEHWPYMRSLVRAGWLALGVAAGAFAFALVLLLAGERPRNLLHRI
ncbi:MAG: murein biosynthesis integral membrane protein MurJ [Pseudomonadales bacterium]|nr:murein biosynthesis integral membrane protein MurJ [Pseudomonadales bacterium]